MFGLFKKKAPVKFNLYTTTGDFSINVVATSYEDAISFCKNSFPDNYLKVKLRIENVFICGNIIIEKI